jgi:hypothetical protein
MFMLGKWDKKAVSGMDTSSPFLSRKGPKGGRGRCEDGEQMMTDKVTLN